MTAKVKSKTGAKDWSSSDDSQSGGKDCSDPSFLVSLLYHSGDSLPYGGSSAARTMLSHCSWTFLTQVDNFNQLSQEVSKEML